MNHYSFRIICKLFFYLIYLFFYEIAAQSHDRFPIEYLYINANSGQSSGGHSAIKFAGTVFHFQFYPDGIFRLVREKWPAFRYQYTTVENRSIWLIPVPVSKQEYENLYMHFNSLYLIRQQQLKKLQSYRQDVRILTGLFNRQRKFFSLPAAGYFTEQSAGMESRAIRRHLKKLVKKEPMDLLTSIAEIEQPVFTEREYPQYDAEKDFSRLYIHALYRDFIEKLLKKPFTLQEETFFTHAGFHSLAAKEIRQLQNYQKLILQYIRVSCHSQNPDYRSILVNTARFLVLQKSIQERRLYFLKTTPKRAVKNENQTLPTQEISFYLQQSRRQLQKAKTQFFQTQHSLEFYYTSWEDRANRFYALKNGIFHGIYQTILLPRRPAQIAIQRSRLKGDIQQKLKIARQNYRIYRAYLQKLYRFDLFHKNCTTELFRVIKQKQSQLFASINGRTGLTFIPFVAARQVQIAYPSAVGREILSFKRLFSKKLTEKENSTLVFWRENFLPTSSLYNHDRPFPGYVFFTDETIWLRPLFGVVNLTSGLSKTLYELPFTPIQGSSDFQTGLKAMLFSFPELVFFNIRKGYFYHIPKSQEEELRGKDDD